MSKMIRKAFNGFGWELLNMIREKTNERMSDAALVEWILGIKKATMSILEQLQ